MTFRRQDRLPPDEFSKFMHEHNLGKTSILKQLDDLGDDESQTEEYVIDVQHNR